MGPPQILWGPLGPSGTLFGPSGTPLGVPESPRGGIIVRVQQESCSGHLVPISVAEGPHLVPISLKMRSPFGPHFEKLRSPFHVGAVCNLFLNQSNHINPNQ